MIDRECEKDVVSTVNEVVEKIHLTLAPYLKGHSVSLCDLTPKLNKCVHDAFRGRSKKINNVCLYKKLSSKLHPDKYKQTFAEEELVILRKIEDSGSFCFQTILESIRENGFKPAHLMSSDVNIADFSVKERYMYAGIFLFSAFFLLGRGVKCKNEAKRLFPPSRMLFDLINNLTCCKIISLVVTFSTFILACVYFIFYLFREANKFLLRLSSFPFDLATQGVYGDMLKVRRQKKN